MPTNIRFLIRQVFRWRGPGPVAILTLGLGIAACITIYSLVYDIFLKPLPYERPDRLVWVWEQNKERDWFQAQSAPANFLDWRERNQSFTDMAAYTDWLESAVVSGAGDPVMVENAFVTGNLFSVLGVSPALGRGMDWEDTWENGLRPIAISHGLWRRMFNGGGDPIGRTIELDGTEFEIAAVMPEDFHVGSRQTDVWIPFEWQPDYRGADWFRRAHFIQVVGRLAEGVTLAAGRADLSRIASQLREEHPVLNRHMGNGVTPLRESLTGGLRDNFRGLVAAVLLVLVIACINVSGLLLAHGVRRRGEFAIRAAMGASRRRLILLSLGEALLIGLVSGLLGFALAGLALQAVATFWAEAVRFGVDSSMDPTALMVGLLAAVVCACAAGIVPALRGGRTRASPLLSGAGRGTVDGRTGVDPRKAMLAVQLGATCVLLTVVLCALAGFYELANRSPGFETRHRTGFQLVLPEGTYDSPEKQIASSRMLLERLESLPGIEAATMTRQLPMSNPGWSSDFAIQGRARDEFGVELRHREVAPSFFGTMGMTQLAGRTLDPDLQPSSPREIVVNQAFVDRYFPGTSPIGRRVAFDRYPTEESTWRTIVGVVSDIRQFGLDEPPVPEAYESLWQEPDSEPFVIVRSTLNPRQLNHSIRAVLADMDDRLPLQSLVRLGDVVNASIANPRLVSAVLLVFGLVAVTLAAVGVAGALMFEIQGRQQEIGVRKALGADKRHLRAWVAARWAGVLAGALAIGALGAWLAEPRLDGWLGGVAGGFGSAWLTASLLVILMFTLTGWLGSRRAARIAPMEALRHE